MRWTKVPVSIPLLLGALAVATPPAAQEETEPPGAVAPPAGGGAPGSYVGMASCATSVCHGSTRDLDRTSVRQSEFLTWSRSDPHSNAGNVLFDETSRRIAGNLGIGAAWEAKLCLDCHSVNVPAAVQQGELSRADGVSCEGCHGPASGWRDIHHDPGIPRSASLAAGMTDLRDLPTRARVCLSCHLGTADKTVDHELIAAGHPALVFELDNYTDGEANRLRPHWNPNPSHGVRAWAVGQVVAFRGGLKQLARQAESGRWPEFEVMSCEACHHSLAKGEWRQRRGYRFRPGLPPWSPARWAALRHLVAAYAPQEWPDLDRLIGRIMAGVAHMNRPADVVQAANEAGQILDRVAPAIAGADWSPAEVRALIGAVAADREFLLTADRASAEQAYFAVHTLTSYLAEANPQIASSRLTDRLLRLYSDELADRDAYDHPQFVASLSSLSREVARLPLVPQPEGERD